MREPRTSVRIRRRSAGVRGESVVKEGRREMNSGINLNRGLFPRRFMNEMSGGIPVLYQICGRRQQMSAD